MGQGARAQQAQPGWIADARTGCKVWNANPKPSETINWSGACANLLAQGSGTLQWFEAGVTGGGNGGILEALVIELRIRASRYRVDCKFIRPST